MPQKRREKPRCLQGRNFWTSQIHQLLSFAGAPPAGPSLLGFLLPQSFAVTHLFLLPGTTQQEGTLSTSRKCSPLQGGPLPAAEASSQVLLANSNSEVPHPFFSFCFLSKVS